MISEIIRDIRKKNFLNQTAFAQRIGVTQGTISQWENGLTRPNSDQLRSISQAFNVSIDTLLNEESESPADFIPKTPEARIISGGINKLPKEQREQALNVMRAMFAQYADFFAERKEDDNT